jgi:hypothetical protein
MDYHFKSESPSTSSVVGGIGLAVGLLVFPYFNPVVSRKDLPTGLMGWLKRILRSLWEVRKQTSQILAK